jgi:hypothetical protein
MGKVSFQTLSNDGEFENKKLGDPVGYCLAWTFWYIEMRINNPLYEPYEIVKISIGKIKDLYNKSLNPFIDFIRDYAFTLNSNKNNLLQKFKISKDKFYNMVHNEKDENIIQKNIIINLCKIIICE